jgi:YfiH family protein
VSWQVPREPIEEFESLGIRAFTTTRDAGSFSLVGDEPVKTVMQRWTALQDDLSTDAPSLVSIRQVHGSRVLLHEGGWSGWLRSGEADGHIATSRGIALAVSIADCVPVFLAHDSGVVGLLHSGWRGTAGRIVQDAIGLMTRSGLAANEIRVHLGPAICGRCYEVDADVRAQLTGRPATRPGNVDLRSLIAEHASELGVQKITVSPECTKCDNGLFFSHRAGDAGRQVSVIVASLVTAT